MKDKLRKRKHKAQVGKIFANYIPDQVLISGIS